MKQRIRTALKVLADPKRWAGYPVKPRFTDHDETDSGLPVTPLFTVERLNESIR
ncbi:MAG: hypothetical protein HN416_18010, partial [Nitrospina sp.]|nr:hypothetical protein [Nitrospina sp.]